MFEAAAEITVEVVSEEVMVVAPEFVPAKGTDVASGNEVLPLGSPSQPVEAGPEDEEPLKSRRHWLITGKGVAIDEERVQLPRRESGRPFMADAIRS